MREKPPLITDSIVQSRVAWLLQRYEAEGPSWTYALGVRTLIQEIVQAIAAERCVSPEKCCLHLLQIVHDDLPAGFG